MRTFPRMILRPDLRNNGSFPSGACEFCATAREHRSKCVAIWNRLERSYDSPLPPGGASLKLNLFVTGEGRMAARTGLSGLERFRAGRSGFADVQERRGNGSGSQTSYFDSSLLFTKSPIRLTASRDSGSPRI